MDPQIRIHTKMSWIRKLLLIRIRLQIQEGKNDTQKRGKKISGLKA
jgi:hypothetical protein